MSDQARFRKGFLLALVVAITGAVRGAANSCTRRMTFGWVSCA